MVGNKNPNRIDTATIQFVDDGTPYGPSEHEKSEIRRYIDLLQDDDKLHPPARHDVVAYVFDTYGGCLDAELADGTTIGTMGASSTTEEWQGSDARYNGDYPTTTDGVHAQEWTEGSDD